MTKRSRDVSVKTKYISHTAVKDEYKLTPTILKKFGSEVPSVMGNSPYGGLMTKYDVNDVSKWVESNGQLLQEMEEARLHRNKRRRIAKEERERPFREELVAELEERGCKLRNDSFLCQEFIEGKSEHPAWYIADVMQEMKWLFQRGYKREFKKLRAEFTSSEWYGCDMHINGNGSEATKYRMAHNHCEIVKDGDGDLERYIEKNNIPPMFADRMREVWRDSNSSDSE